MSNSAGAPHCAWAYSIGRERLGATSATARADGSARTEGGRDAMRPVRARAGAWMCGGKGWFMTEGIHEDVRCVACWH